MRGVEWLITVSRYNISVTYRLTVLGKIFDRGNDNRGFGC